MTISTFDPGPGDRPPATLDTSRGELPLRAVTVRAQIAGVTADVAIEQTFENPYDETLEVSYVFPLPELAAVTRCELAVAGRVVVAKLEERGAAREAYAAAVERGNRAALAEQDRPGVFTITLGNLAPGERATVRFGMAYPLPREDGRHVFRFPLVVAERYTPGTPLAGDDVGDGTHRDTTESPDASRVSPPRLSPGAERPLLDIEIVLVHGELGIEDVESSLHAIEVARRPDRQVIRLAPHQLMDRDFVLRFRLGGDAIRSQLWTQPDGDEGTFQLTVVPPLAPIRQRPRDLVLLLDRSGSMSGWKIVAARSALARMIDALDDDDRFAAYAFGSETIASADLPFDRLHAATAVSRVRAAEFLQGLSANGGTELAHPLELATALLRDPDNDRDRWIVLVTDGQVTNEDALVALVIKTPHAKVLALGIDDAINSSLLRRLATATGGRVEIVQQASELEAALDRLHVLIASPALERVVVTGEGVIEDTLVPAGPLHAFPGVPLVVRGRYRGSLRALRVTAQCRREPFAAIVRAEPCELPALRTCWAREQLLALEDRFASGNRELVPAMIATSIRFGVLCRFTAFIAVDDRGAVESIATRHVQQPVERTAPVIAPRSSVTPSRWGEGNQAERATKTQSGTIRGNFAYLSPEQAKGLPVGPAHEVHVLAHLLWELLTGTSLFPNDGNVFETLVKIIQGVFPVPFLPPALTALEPVLRRALDPDPARRFATPAAFANALEAVMTAPAGDVASWVAAVGGESLARQAALYARLPGLRSPAGGYLVVEQVAVTDDATVYFAVRAGRAIAYRRLSHYLMQDPESIERFLSELAIVDGAHVEDAGTDTAGGVFRAQPFVHGVGLDDLLRHAAPAPIAVAVITAAARTLDGLLALPGPSAIGMIARELAPSALRVGLDGHPVWTSLGVAPAPSFTATRRLGVPLATATGVQLERSETPVLPAVSRSVVVPRGVRVAPPGRARWWT